jgi:hypothetical protein
MKERRLRYYRRRQKVKGAAQMAHGEEVVDLGWNEPKELVAKPLVGGLGNEDLWLLVRRFNKVRVSYQRTWTLIY